MLDALVPVFRRVTSTLQWDPNNDKCQEKWRGSSHHSTQMTTDNQIERKVLTVDFLFVPHTYFVSKSLQLQRRKREKILL